MQVTYKLLLLIPLTYISYLRKKKKIPMRLEPGSTKHTHTPCVKDRQYYHSKTSCLSPLWLPYQTPRAGTMFMLSHFPFHSQDFPWQGLSRMITPKPLVGDLNIRAWGAFGICLGRRDTEPTT